MKIDGETLHKIRITYGLTQTELSALCGVTVSMINKIERKKYPMTDSVLKALVRELSLTPEKIAALLDEYDRIAARKRLAKSKILREAAV